MKNDKAISGFSKWTKEQKIKWLIGELNLDSHTKNFLAGFEIDDSQIQSVIGEMSENPVSNFQLPFSVAPNFMVDGKMKVFPLVTEESSVVAALAKAAGFWAERGGFHTQILGVEKKGQVHFKWLGNPKKLQKYFPEVKNKLLKDTEFITRKMHRRGGGILTIELNPLPKILDNYYQLDVAFDTCDAMGANFINSCLEKFGDSLTAFFAEHDAFCNEETTVEIIMCILSNYVPNSRVKVWVKCPIDDLGENKDEARAFAEKFIQAVHIARHDISRAVTHNKGIFNGIDALALATGNDFRAIEAGGHAFAARDGKYIGLSEAKIENGQFIFSMEIALAVGVVGGVTALHPLTKLAIQILENPTAKELMAFMAVAGLASNWSAVRALVTNGIQQGHMKMHLSNILNLCAATSDQKQAAHLYFRNRNVSYAEVERFLKENA